MDIENLKKEYVKDKIDKEYIENVKRATIVLLKQLINLDKEVWEECGNICLIYMAYIKEEFCNYFIKNGFEIRQETEIIAKYEGLKIKLLKLAEDCKYEAKYILRVGEHKEFYIKLRPSNKYRRMISWNFPLSNNDMLNINKENGKDAIATCNDLKKIKNTGEFLKKKIEDLNDVLSEISSFKYVYTKYEKDKINDDGKIEFDTFEELFKSL